MPINMNALTTFVTAYLLIGLIAAAWSLDYLRAKKPNEWKKGKLNVFLFALYFGLTWPAIFMGGVDD